MKTTWTVEIADYLSEMRRQTRSGLESRSHSGDLYVPRGHCSGGYKSDCQDIITSPFTASCLPQVGRRVLAKINK